MNVDNNVLNNIEHLIIDGQSIDGTVEYLHQINSDHIKWLSEPDNGIYDAMNKGLEMANGEYVIFMNAGDTFSDNSVITRLVNLIKLKTPDIIYGETMYVDSDSKQIGIRSSITTRKLPISLNWKSMKKGMLVCHQSFLVKKSIAPPYILYNLSADIDWQIKCLKQSQNIIQFDGIIANYLIGGISKQRHIESLKDRFKVLHRHYGLLSAIYSHLYFIYRSVRLRRNF
jgi:glycosyltransferase involved in cell wall biosynthesis